ncbi:uncharacterized protein METZ01_LOCUS106524, partial [marine metagenome]
VAEQPRPFQQNTSYPTLVYNPADPSYLADVLPLFAATHGAVSP